MNSHNFYAQLCADIEHLPDLSASSRGQMYAKAYADLEKQIVEATPALSGLAAADLRGQLAAAQQRIEDEFAATRGKEPIGFPDWVKHPEIDELKRLAKLAATNLAEHKRQLAQMQTAGQVESDTPVTHIAADSVAKPVNPPPSSAALFLRDNYLKHRRSFAYKAAEKARMIVAILNRSISVAASSDQLSYFWLVMEPIFQVGIITSLYWFSGRNIIAGMPAIPFSLIGIGTFLMFRTMLMRVSTGLGREWTIVFFPHVNRLDVLIARCLFFGITYFLVIIAALFVFDYFDIAKANLDNPLLACLYWIEFWFMSVGITLVFGYLFTLMPSLKRALLVIVRALFLASGAFFVTEQLPTEFVPYFIWNPIVHGLQLIRSAYFAEYESTDASFAYFSFFTLLIFTFGLVCEQAQNRRVLAP